MVKIRLPAVAGSFYPEDKDELQHVIKGFLDEAKNFKLAPKCIIVPHAGYSYSGVVAAFGFKQLKNLEKKNWKVLLLGPSHYYPFYGLCYANFDYWQTPLGKIKAEKPNLKESELLFEFTEAHEPEHCLEVQLPFLQNVLDHFSIIPLLVGEVEPEKAANELSRIIDEDSILVISSDLSHYHSYEQAIKIDSIANSAIPKLDIEAAQKIEACGKIPILIAMYLAKKLGWMGHFLDYKNSGDTSGLKARVVGYGAYAFT